MLGNDISVAGDYLKTKILIQQSYKKYYNNNLLLLLFLGA